jgi:hypothetical protein
MREKSQSLRENWQLTSSAWSGSDPTWLELLVANDNRPEYWQLAAAVSEGAAGGYRWEGAKFNAAEFHF